MIRALHDRAYRTDLESRLELLTPDTERRWGKMSVDQMLWHVNQAMSVALGHTTAAPTKLPVPPAIAKFIVLHLPWPKGAPTAPEFVSAEPHAFEVERQRCRQLIAEIAERPLDTAWPEHPAFGKMTGSELSRLIAKHLDHHLRQFGA